MFELTLGKVTSGTTFTAAVPSGAMDMSIVFVTIMRPDGKVETKYCELQEWKDSDDPEWKVIK